MLSAIRLYEKFSRGEKLTSDEANKILPCRDLQVAVFKSIKSKPLKDSCHEVLCIRLNDDGENLAAITAAVDIMIEMGILCVDEDNRVFVPQNPPKVNLEDSLVMKKIKSYL